MTNYLKYGMILPPFFHPTQFDDDTTGSIQDITIGGKLLTITMEVNDVDAAKHLSEEEWRDHIKLTLATKMAKAMIEHRLCEFTTQKDFVGAKRRFNIRCYLAKDGDVKIVRTLNVK